jgi:antitoxin ParD1/3/4
MNISLPESLKLFVEQKVEEGTYSTNSEYIKELIRKDLDRERLRSLLLVGAESEQMPQDEQYFQRLRKKITNETN